MQGGWVYTSLINVTRKIDVELSNITVGEDVDATLAAMFATELELA